MTYFEQSLEDHIGVRVSQGQPLSEILADISVQMLECIEQVHKRYHIHRDIKPENFRVHDGRVRITDFGTILRYKEEKTDKFDLIPEGKGFIGTYVFASLNAHNFRTLSLRDDLESLGYALVQLYCKNRAF